MTIYAEEDPQNRNESYWYEKTVALADMRSERGWKWAAFVPHTAPWTYLNSIRLSEGKTWQEMYQEIYHEPMRFMRPSAHVAGDWEQTWDAAAGGWRNADGYLISAPHPEPVPAQSVESPREHVLRTAEKLVMGDRNNQYGPPTQDFSRTAAILNAMGYGHTSDVARDLKGSDVARILAAVKLSRSTWASKEDNWIDLAGYAACAWENEVEENKP